MLATGTPLPPEGIFKENQNTPRPSEHPSVMGEKLWGRSLSPSFRRLNDPYCDYKTKTDLQAIIFPRAIPRPQVFNINDFQCTHGHCHEVLLRKTMRNIGGEKLEGDLAPCSGWMPAGERKSLADQILPTAHQRRSLSRKTK